MTQFFAPKRLSSFYLQWRFLKKQVHLGCLFLVVYGLMSAPGRAQQVNESVSRPSQNINNRDQRSPSQKPLPEPPIAPPPTLDQLKLPPSPNQPQLQPGAADQTVRVQRFQLEGSQVFSQAEIDATTKDFLGRDLTFAQLIQAADAITQLYINRGYITTGALIPADRKIQNGIVPVQVVEGGIAPADIRIRFREGTRHRLNPNFIRQRLALATAKPLNRDRLLDALQLLKLNPVIQDLRVELAAGTRPGQSLLNVEVVEANTFSASLLLDNGRSPSVGTFRRQIFATQANLSGLGDSLTLSYGNTDGSNSGDFSYTLPVNARNGTVSINAGLAGSLIIEPPFDFLEIRSRSRYVEATFRQPVIQTPRQELALGFTFSRQESKATIADGEIPFPVPGSDFEGSTRITSLRFFQEWTQRSSAEVLGLRSQFSFGVPWFDVTNPDQSPGGKYFAWRGQAQWVRLLQPDMLLVVRGDLQVADRPLVPLEQFGLGGIASVRGYRQDALLTDSGFLLSAEVRVPVLRIPEIDGLLQVTPFIEGGKTWSFQRFQQPQETGTDSLLSVGFGLRFQMSNRLTARFDWGIPLISLNRSQNTLQEKGLYFSLVYTPF